MRNYTDHHKEAVAHGIKREITASPSIFLRVWRSTIAHGGALDEAETIVPAAKTIGVWGLG